MKKLKEKLCRCLQSSPMGNKSGMEMVQVAILVAIAVAVGIIFKSSITDFVNGIFDKLNGANF